MGRPRQACRPAAASPVGRRVPRQHRPRGLSLRQRSAHGRRRRRAPFASAATARSSSRSAPTSNRTSRSTRAVRDGHRADAPLRVDVNGAWTPGTARRQLEKLRELDLAYVEQPLELDDLAGHAALRAAQPRPDRARRIGLYAERRRQHRAHGRGRRDPARSARGRRPVGVPQVRRDRRVGRPARDAAQRRRARACRKPRTCTSRPRSPT